MGLSEADAGTLQVPEDFFLEGIAAAPDGVEIELAEQVGAEAAERAAAIAWAEARAASGRSVFTPQLISAAV